MTVGGSGFLTLFWKDKRLAYLQIDPDARVQIRSARDYTKAKFYELWNEAEWMRMTKGALTALAGLQRALDQKELRLCKIIKAPSGIIREIEYDLTDVILREVGDPEENIVVAGMGIAKNLRFDSPHTIFLHGGGRQLPAKEKPKEPEPMTVPGHPVIERLREAVRQFDSITISDIDSAPSVGQILCEAAQALLGELDDQAHVEWRMVLNNAARVPYGSREKAQEGIDRWGKNSGGKVESRIVWETPWVPAEAVADA